MSLSSSHACLQFQSVCDQAVECWWEDDHPGWAIFSLGGQHFETLGQIIAFGRDGGRSGMDNPVVRLPAVESRHLLLWKAHVTSSHYHHILQPTGGQGSNTELWELPCSQILWLGADGAFIKQPGHETDVQ